MSKIQERFEVDFAREESWSDWNIPWPFYVYRVKIAKSRKNAQTPFCTNVKKLKQTIKVQSFYPKELPDEFSSILPSKKQ